MIRRATLLLLLARIGLYDWFGSPWRVVAQIMLPPLYVLILPVLILWNGLEQPSARIAVADIGEATRDLRPTLREIDWISRSGMSETEAMRRLGQSQFDAVLVPMPDAAVDGGPIPLELRVRDPDFFLWSFLKSVVEGGQAPARILLDPQREAEEGTPPGIVAGFLTVLGIFGAVGVLQTVHADRISGWGRFLRIAPISGSTAMSGLGLGRWVVNLLSTLYLVWLIHVIVGLPQTLSWPAFAAAIVLTGTLFALIGVLMGVWIPAYRGSAETVMQVVWPLLLAPSPVLWDAAGIPALRPLVMANPVTPAYDVLRAALGAEPTVYGAVAAWSLLMAWLLILSGGIALRSVLMRRAEAMA